MKTLKNFKVIGGYTIIHYQSRVYEANSEEEALEMAEFEIEENPSCYYEWEMHDIKDIDDFGVVEVISL